MSNIDSAHVDDSHLWVKLDGPKDLKIMNLEDQLKAADALARAVRAFLEKQKSVEQSPAYVSVWSVAQTHVGPYQGTQWIEERKDCEKALAAYDKARGIK